MRCDRGVNQRIALPALQKFLGVLQHRGVRFIVWRRKIKNRFAHYAAHSRGFGLFGNDIFEVVHVGERRHASANLLRRRQPRAPADKFLGHIFGFRREDVFPQPLVERHIVAQPAKQRHRHVRVPVNETRQHEFPFGIDGLPRRHPALARCRFALPHFDNPVALDSNEAVLQDAALGIHRHQRAADDKEIYLGKQQARRATAPVVNDHPWWKLRWKPDGSKKSQKKRARTISNRTIHGLFLCEAKQTHGSLKNEILEKHASRKTEGPQLFSQIGGIEGLRKKILHANHFGFALEICHDHGNVAAKFPDQLAASATGRR